MTVFNSGPFNIEQGNQADFVIQFLDSTGATTVPSSASLVINYINTSFASASDTVNLFIDNEQFKGSWISASANLGLATWVAATSIGSSVGATGQLRIIQRVSTY